MIIQLLQGEGLSTMLTQLSITRCIASHRSLYGLRHHGCPSGIQGEMLWGNLRDHSDECQPERNKWFRPLAPKQK